MDRPALRPPFAYYGGKTLLAEQIAAMLPTHEHYVEPFAGSLAVLLAKPAARWETVNDLDGDLVTFWRVLRDQPVDLARLASLTPHSREEYVTSSRALDVESDLERARRVWVLLTQNRSQSMRHSGWKYRADASMGTSMPDYLAAYAERIESAAQRLRNVSLENRDALDVIRDYGKHANVCIYADPPYLGSTRATGYRHELKGDDQHRVLADALNACEASIVLSGYDSPLYAELFDGWHATRLKAPTSLSGEGGRVEVLWSNRPLGEPDLFGGVA